MAWPLGCRLWPGHLIRAAQILVRLPYTALSSIGEAHVLLNRSGCTDDDFDDVWRTALNAPEASAVERPPHRLIGRAWLSGLVGGPWWRDVDALLPFTVLATAPSAVHLTRASMYAITHTAWYVTDFGARSLPALLDRHRSAELIDDCLAFAVGSGDFDILGEMLAAAVSLGLSPSPAYRLGRRVLFDAWRSGRRDAWSDPKMQRASGPISRLLRRQGNDAAVVDAVEFRKRWHWLYVVSLFAACELWQRHHGTDGGPPGPGCRSGTACKTLLTAWLDRRPDSGWLRQLMTTSWDDDFPVLLDGVVIQLARSYDVSHLSWLLDEARQHGIAASPAVAAAERLVSTVRSTNEQTRS
jgi:hypothetical protein